MAVAADGGGEQLELTLGPLYHVVVDDRVSGPLTGRPTRSYRSPPQGLEEARCLAALLLDRGDELDGDGPWRRPLAGGQRHVAIVLAAPGQIGGWRIEDAARRVVELDWRAYDIVVVPVSTLDRRPDAPQPQLEGAEDQRDG